MGIGTAAVSLVLSAGSSGVSATLGVPAAVAALALVIAIGIAADVVGVAATASSERAFHAMAADRVTGATQAIWLVRHADRVANFANDIMGDIAGTLSGAMGAALVVRLVPDPGTARGLWVAAGMVALVSGVTVGGKAAVKSFAIRRSEDVVLALGRVFASLEGLLGRPMLPELRPGRPSSRRRRSRQERAREP